MKIINKKGPTIWQMDKWYDKTFYVLGQIWAILFSIGFIFGLIEGLTS